MRFFILLKSRPPPPPQASSLVFYSWNTLRLNHTFSSSLYTQPIPLCLYGSFPTPFAIWCFFLLYSTMNYYSLYYITITIALWHHFCLSFPPSQVTQHTKVLECGICIVKDHLKKQSEQDIQIVLEDDWNVYPKLNVWVVRALLLFLSLPSQWSNYLPFTATAARSRILLIKPPWQFFIHN